MTLGMVALPLSVEDMERAIELDETCRIGGEPADSVANSLLATEAGRTKMSMLSGVVSNALMYVKLLMPVWEQAVLDTAYDTRTAEYGAFDIIATGDPDDIMAVVEELDGKSGLREKVAAVLAG